MRTAIAVRQFTLSFPATKLVLMFRTSRSECKMSILKDDPMELYYRLTEGARASVK